MYKCVYCGKQVNIDLATAKKIICPSCGLRIVEKDRTKVTKKVMSS